LVRSEKIKLCVQYSKEKENITCTMGIRIVGQRVNNYAIPIIFSESAIPGVLWVSLVGFAEYGDRLFYPHPRRTPIAHSMWVAV
jgi:hypothetical protein